MYSSPAAEYVRNMQRQHKRRLWKERAAWALLNVVFFIPMFADWFK